MDLYELVGLSSSAADNKMGLDGSARSMGYSSSAEVFCQFFQNRSHWTSREYASKLVHAVKEMYPNQNWASQGG